MVKQILAASLMSAAIVVNAAVSEKVTLWKGGDNGVKVYRIPALVTAPNGDLVAACDARKNHGGDLNTCQPINITIRRSSDNGKTWTAPVNSYTWPWSDSEKWAGSDPSMVVDSETKTIFLFYNVWECVGQKGVFQFWVQESKDNGKTWSKPRDISKDIAHPEWPFGKTDKQGGFIFISSGSGIQTADGTLLHTIVHVGDGNALFGSTDHGKTWKPIGHPVKYGDECKVVEYFEPGDKGKKNPMWMINSRWRGGGRQIHISKDRGNTWDSHYDGYLTDPQCNAQIARFGGVMLFSNCNSTKRNNLYLRASRDNGKTWNEGISICPGDSAYSDLTRMKNGDFAIIYEGAGYNTIEFVTVPKDDVKASLGK